MELYPKNATLFCCRLNWLLSALQSPCIGRLLYREKKDERKVKEGAVIAEVGRETKKDDNKIFRPLPIYSLSGVRYSTPGEIYKVWTMS
jgi:hypothetical protein